MFEPKDGMVITTHHPALREAHEALAITAAYLTGVLDTNPNGSSVQGFRDKLHRAAKSLEEAVS
jgi:hypothetical protein